MPTYETQRVNKSSVSSKSSGVKQKTQAGSGHAMSSANTDGSSNSRSKLHRQLSITKDGLQEDKIRQQMHKQESKDSGIVTEMYTRPKDFSPQPESSSNKGAISKDLASPRSDRSSKAMPKDITRSVSDKGASTKTRRTSDSKRSSSLKGTSKKRGSLKSTSDHVHDRKDKQEEGEVSRSCMTIFVIGFLFRLHFQKLSQSSVRKSIRDTGRYVSQKKRNTNC